MNEVTMRFEKYFCFLKEPRTYSCPGPGWEFLNLVAECGVVPQGCLTFLLHQRGQLSGHSAEVGRIKENQDGVLLCQSWKDIELIFEGLGQSRDHRTEAWSQSAKASLTPGAWAQGREKILHRLASKMLGNWNKKIYITVKSLEKKKYILFMRKTFFLSLHFHYFTTPGNVWALRIQGKERAVVADTGPVQGQTGWKYVLGAQGCGKTASPAGGDAAGDRHHPMPPGS